MYYQHRIYRVSDIDDAGALAEKLTEQVWTSCTAFRFGDLVFANDSSCGDSLQEYAVFRGDALIESLTVSWIEPSRLIEMIARFARRQSRDTC